ILVLSLCPCLCPLPLHPPSFFFLMLRPPPTSTLFPYTTLFRSVFSIIHIGKKIQFFFAFCFSLSPTSVVCTMKSRRKLISRRLRSEEHTSELQSRFDLVCRLLLEKKKYT